MAQVIHGTTIITADDESRVLFDAAIAIDGGRIAAIGPDAEILPRFPQAERIDGRWRAVMPGFANTHTHLSLTIARGIFEDLSPPHRPPFCAGISPIPTPELSREEMAVMVQLGALEAIRSGTTALLEDGKDIADYAPWLAATGIRLLLAERAWDRADSNVGDPGPFRPSEAIAEDSLERIERLHTAWNGQHDGRIRTGMAPWAPDMCTPGLLHRLQDQRQRLSIPCTIHLNQVWGEIAAVQAHRGMRPTEYLAAEGFLHPGMIAAHCRCMVHEEERLLGRARVNVAFNAAIAARRGLSPRISVLEAEGCNIAMGTDNMAEDMVEVMRTGLFMERIRREDGRTPMPEEALRWATRNGYAAMGVPDGGWLALGNRADLVLIRTDRAHLVPMTRPLSSFVHQGQASDVDSVMVDGHWIMRDGVVRTMDEPTIIREADRIARRAWNRLFTERPETRLLGGVAPPA
ncbi:5-methylthioadenosine/S-adenosylhomocysteine deaminase [Roseomonas rosea]|uniref:5-methylthioadenosine/S-adenosylhomocysteine deaminase n=1 Tax=Muricoccus roseus TaxID=198092 RepID=A0A1M6RHP8_9PROT|nr:amidohydrolase family protein [Roseomonas rosea]SHK31960.1 5-methylthioadenosine/S-adenosylhomocysteine deaminase [Roseomonas rosea]